MIIACWTLLQVRCRNYRNVKILQNHNFAAVLPGDSMAGLVVANGISNFLNLYNTLLVVRLVLTWFPNSPSAIVGPLRCAFKLLWIYLTCKLCCSLRLLGIKNFPKMVLMGMLIYILVQHNMWSILEHIPGTHSTTWRDIGSLSYTGIPGSKCLY